MAVIYCQEQQGSGKRNASVNKDSITRQRVFIVKTNSGSDDSTVVEVAPSISLGNAHPNDSLCFCMSVDSAEIEPLIWTVTFTYETLPPGECENPLLNCDPIYKWNTEKEEEAFNEDVDGKKVVNSAKDPFQPAPTRLKSRVVLTVTYNASSFSGATALALDNKINSDTFEGAAPKTLLLSIESATQQFHKLVGYYWQITLKMTYNPDGWSPMKIMDTGMREIDPDDATKKRLIKLKGREVTSPVPLKDGTAIEDPTQDPDFIEVKPYEEKAFSSLF